MSDRLDVPRELQHLIEKRELEDRRIAERRAQDQQSGAMAETDGETAPPNGAPDAGCQEEQEPDRRGGDDRRQDIRRAADRAKLEHRD